MIRDYVYKVFKLACEATDRYESIPAEVLEPLKIRSQALYKRMKDNTDPKNSILLSRIGTEESAKIQEELTRLATAHNPNREIHGGHIFLMMWFLGIDSGSSEPPSWLR